MDMMVRSFLLRCLVLVGFLTISSSLWSYNPHEAQNLTKCHCGCACGAECKCGCAEGQVCCCHHLSGYSDPGCSMCDLPEFHVACSKYKAAQLCPWYGGNCVIDTTEPYDCSIPCQGYLHCAECPDPCKFYTTGEWFPEKPPLFRPFIADPRQITASVGWRFNDDALTKNIIPVSYFDTVPIYRWGDIWPWHGKLQIDIEGALWACFDPCTDSAPLMNADYYIGLPITYAIDYWSFRFRVFHISSHLGDEFLLNNPGYDRRNPSAEYADFFASYELTSDIRLYGGLGYVIQYDDSFRFSRLYAEWGAEVRAQAYGYRDSYNAIYGVPIFGMHYRWRHDFEKHIDATYIAGYEWGKLVGLRHRYRIFAEYHDGFSCEGQFYRCFTNYLAIRFTWGF